MLPQTFTTDHKIRVGVLLAPPPVQLLDLAPTDLFHMLSKEYLGVIEFLPKPIKDLAISQLEILYVADEEDSNVKKMKAASVADSMDPAKSAQITNTMSLAPLTADASIQLTTDLNSSLVQPGNLTILLIPGPDPSAVPSERAKSFISSHATCGTTDIITICTGIFPACYSGICDGKTVAVLRGLRSQLIKKFPKVEKFEDLRWTKDVLTTSKSSRSTSVSKGSELENSKGMRPAELWTSAGITNGHDCIAAYIRAHINRELGDVVLRMADVGERSQRYDVGPTTDGVWWMTTILRALVKGLWR